MTDIGLIDELKVIFSKSKRIGIIDLDNFLGNRKSFNLLRLEDLYEKTKGVIPPFRKSDFFILFVKEGRGTRSIGAYTFPIKDNTLAVIPKRVIHAALYSCRPTGYLVALNPDFFVRQSLPYKLLNNKKLLKSTVRPFVVLTEDQATQVINIFEMMIEECNSTHQEKKEMIALKVLELLILGDRFFASNLRFDTAETTSDTIQRLNELIEKHFLKHRDVHFYADALHTHPNNLNHIVKKATGLTAKQTVTDRLLLEAKYLLVSTNMTVKEIAFELG